MSAFMSIFWSSKILVRHLLLHVAKLFCGWIRLWMLLQTYFLKLFFATTFIHVNARLLRWVALFFLLSCWFAENNLVFESSNTNITMCTLLPSAHVIGKSLLIVTPLAWLFLHIHEFEPRCRSLIVDRLNNINIIFLLDHFHWVHLTLIIHLIKTFIIHLHAASKELDPIRNSHFWLCLKFNWRQS